MNATTQLSSPLAMYYAHLKNIAFAALPKIFGNQRGNLAGFECMEIQRSIDYYVSHFGQPTPIGLSILPGFDRAEALGAWLKDQLDQSVEVFDITRYMECETTLDPDGIDQQLIAIGGALRREEVAL